MKQWIKWVLMLLGTRFQNRFYMGSKISEIYEPPKKCAKF